MRHTGEHAGGGVVGRNQRQVQHVAELEPVVGLEVGRGGGIDVAAFDGDGLVEVRIVLEEDDGRHHLGDAGDRALVLRVLLPEHLAGWRG